MTGRTSRNPLDPDVTSGAIVVRVDANTVGTVAELSGISVRTLHHYDHIGLVVPSVRTTAGYRRYTDADVERLHLVLVYRAVGLPLDEIRTLLDDQDVDVPAHLRRQHQLLLEQAERLTHTIKAVEELMNAHSDGIQLTAQEQVEIFGTTAFGGEYAEEAEGRWSETDEWKQSRQRVRGCPSRTGSTSRPRVTRCSPRSRRPSGLASNRLVSRRRPRGAAPRLDRALLRLRG
jgi:DNA-binding transcriptional MerR regulator